MDYFEYKEGVLHAENVAIPEIAEAVGTPFYCYSQATLERHYNVMAEAFSAIPTTICFAVKANSNIAVLKILANLGAGADTVSEGEIRRAIMAGIVPEKIVFSGVGKTKQEMKYALEAEIGQFNVESIEELRQLSEVALSNGKIAKIALRINPDVDAGTHDKISTGRKDDKFGIPWDMAVDTHKEAASLAGLEVVGITTHIGSQLTKLEPFDKAFEKIVSLVERLRLAGHKITKLDLGGGLGIPYANENPPSPVQYAEMIIERIKHLGCELELEPGRLIAGNAGILVTSLIYMKKTSHRNFAVVDAAMNDLARPALYGSEHSIIPVEEKPLPVKADVVGPVCETADIFGRDIDLPELQPDDLLALRSAGAYGAVMSGTYNSRNLVPEVLVKGDEFTVVRERQSYDEMLEMDSIPQWL